MRTFLSLVLVALLTAGAMYAQDRVRLVKDDAGIFSKKAIDDANKIVAKIAERHHKDLVIETVKEVPIDTDRAAWSRSRFNDANIDGVYVVFCRNPKFFRIEVGNQTLKRKYFSQDDIAELA